MLQELIRYTGHNLVADTKIHREFILAMLVV
jgi:hypothetical protein